MQGFSEKVLIIAGGSEDLEFAEGKRLAEEGS